MSQKLIGSLLMAALLVLAGCTGGMGPTDETTTASGGDAATTGTVNFYISDQENAIGDFEHLNVTVDAVSFRKAGGDEETETTTTATTAEETTASETATETTAQTTAETTVTQTTAEEAALQDNETETEETATMTEAENETEAESESDDGWETYDVDAKTFDLTQLQGENAEKLSEFDLEAGTYTEVRLHISDVNGTLTDGEKVNVKLPSNTLKIKSEFTVDAESETDFVYDITVHSAGNSGKYVIKPVVSESGANIPYTDIGAKDDEEADAEEDDEGEESDDADDLSVEFVGEVVANENATVKVTQAGEPVADANVTVNGEVVGTTDEDGTLTFSAPAEGDVEVKAVSGEAEGEAEVSLSAAANASANGNGQGTETAA
ncbi:DUF4382 domain-containing protein [Haladaptatus sp. CMSO5]|uniref:DUF4382 domain-containing protein n=1 Tax=Haladaptatus sp. CMSO5 TaxID=3120514 RepID=UPI002FCE18B1